MIRRHRRRRMSRSSSLPPTIRCRAFGRLVEAAPEESAVRFLPCPLRFHRAGLGELRCHRHVAGRRARHQRRSFFHQLKNPRAKRKLYAVDASGQLPNGETFEDVQGLKAALMKEERTVAGSVFEGLLCYALGRDVSFTDGPFIDAVLDDLEADHFPVREMGETRWSRVNLLGIGSDVSSLK